MKAFQVFISAALLIIAGSIMSRKQPKKLTPGEGYIHLKAGKIWYKIVGDGDKTPILTLHGGPGVPS